MLKKIFVTILLFLSLIYAQASEFSEAKALVDSGVSCDKLGAGQLEQIGDFYMEKMNPGEAHELMEQMMGGEGSESLRQMHIAMARRLYCNESAYGIPGMMGLGGGYMGGMMGYGGMMDYGFGWFWVLGVLFWILFFVLLVLSIIWLFRNLAGRTSSTSSPLDTLKLRYAKGEISKKEFDEMKKQIE